MGCVFFYPQKLFNFEAATNEFRRGRQIAAQNIVALVPTLSEFRESFVTI